MGNLKTVVLMADHPILTPHKRVIEPPTYLFHEAEPLKCAYLIISGYIVLLAKKGKGECVVSFSGPGQILGEQVIMGNRGGRRAFSARAHSEAVVTEITPRLMSEIKKNHLPLLAELYRQVAKISLERLKRSNFLIRGFRSLNKVERMVRLILYLCDAFGRDGEQGREVYLPHHLLNYYMAIPQQEFSDVLRKLTKKGALIPTSTDCYHIPDIELLRKTLPSVVDDLPNFPML